MKKYGKFFALIFMMLAVTVFSGCGSASQNSGYRVQLEMWGLFDDSTDFSEIINQYKILNPYIVDIKYRKFSPDTYEKELIEALASGNGPDIFLIHNSWLPSYIDKLEAAPKEITNEQEMRANFPDVVADDYSTGGNIFALPLSMDSLQLYYNKDIFNAAGITAPPKTWEEFNNIVRMLTSVDKVGNILQSGAALGVAQNINRAPDLLSVLMLQNGVQMTDEKHTSVTFDRATVGPNGQLIKGAENALMYYTQFGRVGSPLYTWNSRMHYSIDAFIEGKTAMLFNYSWQKNNIEAQNSKLNFGTAPLPQLDSGKPVTFANYWAFGVSKNKYAPKAPATGSGVATQQVPNSVRTHEAWQFLRFLTMKNSGNIRMVNAVTKASKEFPLSFDPAEDYLKKTENPAARRDLIDKQKIHPVLGPFASGNLIAKSWYRQDPAVTENVLIEMIESVSRGEATTAEAISAAKTRLDRLMQTNQRSALPGN